MKICYKCGTRNFYQPGEKIECKNCGEKFKQDSALTDPKACKSGEATPMKLMHDETYLDRWK